MARHRGSQIDSVHPDVPTSVEVAVTLDVFRLPSSRADLAALPCPKCQVSLNIHQPDAETPTRLLGTCTECGVWCLLTMDASRSEARLIVLPPDSIT